MRRITAAFLALAAGTASVAKAEAAGTVWSLDEHPVPTGMEFKDEDWARVDAMWEKNGDPTCSQREDIYLDIYERRYPDFRRKVPDRRDRMALWKVQGLAAFKYALSTCVREWFEKIDRRYGYLRRKFGGLFYCGRWTRPPITADEKRFVELVEEGVVYASTTLPTGTRMVPAGKSRQGDRPQPRRRIFSATVARAQRILH